VGVLTGAQEGRGVQYFEGQGLHSHAAGAEATRMFFLKISMDDDGLLITWTQGEVYSTIVKLFEDLPIISMPSGSLVLGGLEKFLYDIGMLRHVEVCVGSFWQMFEYF
jgi:threonine dehydratase